MMELRGDHMMIPWLVRHSAATVDRFQIGSDGKTSYERRKGKKFNKELVEPGECVWYLMAKSKGQTDMESRWRTGVWLGIRSESNEVIIGTSEGVVKARSIRRNESEEESWCKDKFDKIKGTPWQPVPGVGSEQIKVAVALPDADPPVKGQVEVQDPEEVMMRQFKMTKKDFERFGYTPHCRGCSAVKNGTGYAAHKKECRDRIRVELEKVNDPRLVREAERLSRYVKDAVEGRAEDESKQVIEAPERDNQDEEMRDSGAVPFESEFRTAMDDGSGELFEKTRSEVDEEVAIEEEVQDDGSDIPVDLITQAWDNETVKHGHGEGTRRTNVKNQVGLATQLTRDMYSIPGLIQDYSRIDKVTGESWDFNVVTTQRAHSVT